MTILVTGATGGVGRMVVLQLVDAGEAVRALTIDPARAALPPTVTTFTGNIRRPSTLEGAFDGIERMYLAPAPETAERVVGMATVTGVGHIVDLSGEPESWWYPVAAAVEAAGVSWTHLWAGEFMENSTIWAEQIRTTGSVRDAYPDSANAPIAMSDVAAVAAAALLGDGHDRQAYDLHGPETLTSADRVAHIAAALGRDIRFIEVSRDEAIAQLEPQLGEYAAWYVDGRAELLAADEQDLASACMVGPVTGRPALTFAEWARLNVDSFR